MFFPRTTLPIIVVIVLILAAGCTGVPETNPPTTAATSSPAGQAYERGLTENAAGNYRSAELAFADATTLYAAAGDRDGTRKARDARFRAFRSYIEYSLNETQAVAAMNETFPSLTDTEIRSWLDTGAQKIVSENETLYFDVAANYLSAHPDLRRKTEGQTIDIDAITRWAWAANRTPGDVPYVNPVHYSGTERLAIPHQYLPADGVIRIWFPLPVETESQRNITVTNLSYPEYRVKGPFTTGDIGYVYYEIPAEKIPGDLVLTADIAFTSYEQSFRIDPAAVGSYTMSDPEYHDYTVSERNIGITDAVRARAQAIVADETNPYLQAQKIYRWMLSTYTYSHVPHISLDTRQPKIAESAYMFDTSHGDCGTQSMLFAALCRSLGIPARATGGYQMLITKTPSPHFWAQYYVPGYGWVPTDLTLAEGGEWFDIPDEKRELFRSYYAGSLDPARLVFQKKIDLPLDPPLPDDAVLMRAVLQHPAIVADSSELDLDLYSGAFFSVDLSESGQ